MGRLNLAGRAFRARAGSDWPGETGDRVSAETTDLPRLKKKKRKKGEKMEAFIRTELEGPGGGGAKDHTGSLTFNAAKKSPPFSSAALCQRRGDFQRRNRPSGLWLQCENVKAREGG